MPERVGGLLTATQSRRGEGSGESSQSTGLGSHWEPLRQGAPGRLPWLPLQSLPLEDGILSRLWNSSLGNDVVRILRDQGVEFFDVGLLRRVPYPDVTYENIRQDDRTVFVTANASTDDKWAKAIDAIRQTLIIASFPDVCVEILDPKILEKHHLLPVQPNDPIIGLWPKMLPVIHEILSSCRWTSIGVVVKGPASTQIYKTTILVTLSVNDYGIYIDETHSISRFCAQHGLSHVSVELRRAAEWRLGDAASSHIQSNDQIPKMYEKRAYMGQSISTRVIPPPGNGTFGGLIELIDLKTSKSRGVFGITCWHVANTGIPAGEFRKKYDTDGMSPGDENGKNVVFVHPGYSDHMNHIDEIDGDLVLARERNFPMVIEELELKKRTLLEAWTKHGRLGTLLCGSGLARKSENNHRLDWALIAIGRDCVGSNDLPLRTTFPVKAPFDSNAPRKMVEFGKSCRSSDHVYKVGKASGATVGTYNEVRFRVRMDGETLESDEYCFLSTDRRSNGQSFSERGDSGAMVWDGLGRWVGLIWGGNENVGNNGITYVTDIQDLIYDIQKSTGCRVQLPR